MPVQYNNTKDSAVVHRSYLIFGATKTGKTRLVTTLPAGKTLLVNVENNLDSIAGADVITTNCYDVQSWKDIYEEVKARPPEWLFIDSISALLQKVFGEEFKKTKDGRAAYSAVERSYYDIIGDIKKLPCNVVCIGQMGQIKDEITGGLVYGASLPWAKLEHALPYNFSAVVAARAEKMQDGSTYYGLQCQPDTQYKVGVRTNYGQENPLAMVEPADILALHNKISGITPQPTTKEN